MPNLELIFPPLPDRVPDADQRERALDITQSFLVEAPAGSGKTGLLIQRFLKLLGSDSVEDPRQVLAITFTRKATAEMLDRVLTQLQLAKSHPNAEADSSFEAELQQLAAAVLLRDARLGWNLLDNPGRLNIRTIDSLSSEIASALPVLSGSGGMQSPTDDASALFAEAARRTLMLLGGDDAALTAALELLLLHRDGNLANCEDLIASMLGSRDQWGELVPLAEQHLNDRYLDETVLPSLDRALDRAISSTLTRVAASVSQPLLSRLCELASEMGELEGYKGNPSPLAVCAGHSQPPEERAEDLDHWRALADLVLTAEGAFRATAGLRRNHLKFEIQAHHKVELANIIDAMRSNEPLRRILTDLRTLPPTLYPRDQWPVTKALFRVLARALAELQLVFAERGQCDFTEVSLLARAALRNDSALDDLAASSGSRLQHLLVDEMQDTSSGQYEFLQLLTRRWDGHGQTVFLVGDPKQSIYLFRQARVERFLSTLRTGYLGDIPLTVLRLTANFRSRPPLVQSFNEDFGAILAPSAGHEDISYTPATAVRSGDGQRIWHPHPIPYPGDRDTSRAHAQDHADEIRVIIEGWRARPLPPGRTEPWRIAVLVRNRSHLRHVVAALRQSAPIPFRAVEIDPLAERPEILDLLALTRALLHPADRTAWLALLRSPVCGLSLADLDRLAGHDSERTLFELMEVRGDELSADGIARLQPFWQIAAEAHRQRGSLRLAEWVARTWRAFGVPQHLTPDALANAAAFFRLLDQLEQPGPALDLAHLAEKVAGLYAAPSTEPGAVDLMTLHKAKGLEWDVVLVPELQRASRNSQGQLLDWLETAQDEPAAEAIAAGILAPISSKGKAAGQLNQWMRITATAREAAERKRLFYVACTRAREELHLFAAPTYKKDGSLSVRTDSLLFAAWPAAEARFTAPANVVAMPRPAQRIAFSIAATVQPRIIQRIPTVLAPVAPAVAVLSPPAFSRPEGSFPARAFGNAVHAFLELLATRIANGESSVALLAELPGWSARISAVLRGGGLSPADVTRYSASVLRGLTSTLNDPDGQWILAAHPEAASESALSDETSSLRLDRVFLAGPAPLAPGCSHLWIVDFKTSSHGADDLAAFLAAERLKYAPQLETYARSLARQSPHPLRVALYYPMLPQLIWWEPE